MSLACDFLLPPQSRTTTTSLPVRSRPGIQGRNRFEFLDPASYGLAVSEVAQSDPIETGAHDATALASLNEANHSENGIERPLRKSRISTRATP